MPLSNTRLLLIEDNPGDVRLIQEMILSQVYQGIVLETAATLKAGLERLAAQTFDVVLLDLSLPDSHGLDTLRAVSAAASGAPIVVLTGNEDETLGLQTVQLGAQDYLPKSDVDSKSLLRSLRYAVERHRNEVIIRQSEQEYRSLIDDVFNTSMVAVLILDRAFRVVWCNEATEIYFGITRENLLGKDSRLLIEDELKCIFADPDDYSARLLKAYEGGEFTDRFECHVLPAEGRAERWLEHWSQPIREGKFAGGRIEQYMDITERKGLEIAEAEQRRFTDALRDISALLTSTLDLKEVLGRILNNLGRIVPHDSASVMLLEADHFWIAQHRTDARRGTQELVAEKQMQLEAHTYLQGIFAAQVPVILPDLQSDPQMQAAAGRANVRGYVGAPIRLQQQIIGFMNVFSEQVGFFTPTHAERLMAFAELAAVAIQNARLYQRSQELAAVQERQRLARDLHDSVSQTLFTCRTMAESALRRWDKDAASARALMEEVYRLTVAASAEMRILLLELRPTSLTQVSLKQLFEQYLQPIQARRDFQLHLAVDDLPNLPPDVQIALYRIAQEALNNIDKHARAKQVVIHVTNHADHITLHISDDGEGFDMQAIGGMSLGLGIMRERAESIGATLHLESRLGEGTHITLVWHKQ